MLTVMFPSLAGKLGTRSQSEMKTLGHTLDTMARAEMNRAADVLAQRIKALERATHGSSAIPGVAGAGEAVPYYCAGFLWALSLSHPCCRTFVDLVFLMVQELSRPVCCCAWLAFSLFIPWVLNFFPSHPPPRNSEQLLEQPESVDRSGARLFAVCSGGVGPCG